MHNQSSSVPKPSIWAKVFVIATLVLVSGTIISQWRSMLGFARNWDDFSEGSVEAKQLRNIPDMLNYIALHRDQFSLVAFDVGAEEDGIYLNADRPRPIAATAELQLLLGYSAQLASGELHADTRISVADWERFHLPRTDGGSHEYAMRALRAAGAEKDGQVELQDLVLAMLRYSDDSAADMLMMQLGRAQVEALPAQLGIPDEDPAWPMSGQLQVWREARPDGKTAQNAQGAKSPTGRSAYVDAAWAQARLLADPARGPQQQKQWQEEGLTLSLREQADLTSVTSPRGRARAYARLMARVAAGELPGSRQAQDALGWIKHNAELSQRFDSIGTQAGSLPGALSSAYFARAKGHHKVRVLAMFADRLPIAVWLQLMEKFLHQRFETQLLGDDAYFEQVKQRLAQ